MSILHILAMWHLWHTFNYDKPLFLDLPIFAGSEIGKTFTEQLNFKNFSVYAPFRILQIGRLE